MVYTITYFYFSQYFEVLKLKKKSYFDYFLITLTKIIKSELGTVNKFYINNSVKVFEYIVFYVNVFIQLPNSIRVCVCVGMCVVYTAMRVRRFNRLTLLIYY